MYKVFVTEKARNDLRSIREYISVDLDNEKSAVKIVGNIVNKIGQLGDMPEIGASLSSRVSIKTNYRYLVCGNYNIFYRIEDSTVKIIRILNSRRNFMAILFGKEY